MDIAEFYAANERRRESVEVTFGDGWTSEGDPHATYRLQFIAATGELVAVREPHPGGLLARYLDAAHLDQADVAALQVSLLGRFADQAEAEGALADWPRQMTGADSLAWAASQAGRPSEPAPGR